MKRNSYYIFLVIVGIVIFVLNCLTAPTLSDDLLYRFVFPYNENEPIELVNSFSDVIRSQVAHYYTVNGRTVVHSTIQLLLWLCNQNFIHVLNAVMFVLLLYLCVYFINNYNQQLLAAVLFCFLLFVVIKSFQSCMLWIVGSINYLWTLVIILSFLLFLRYIKDKPLLSLWVCLSPLALLVGWSHEGISLPLSLTFLLYLFLNRKIVVRHAVFPFIFFFVLGTLCDVLSPALWERADAGLTLKSRLIIGLVNLLTNIRILWFLIILLIATYRYHKDIFTIHIHHWVYAYFMLFLTLCIVIVGGAGNERVGFFTDFIALLLFVSLLLLWPKINSISQSIVMVLCLLMLLIIIPVTYLYYQNMRHTTNIVNQLKDPMISVVSVKQIDENYSGLLNIIRTRYVDEPVIFGFYVYYQAFDPQNRNVRCAAYLYGKDNILFLPSDVVEYMEKDEEFYDEFHEDEHRRLIVKRLSNNQRVHNVTIELTNEVNNLHFYQYLLTYPNNEYKLTNDQFKVIKVANSKYLVLLCPTSNIYRRIAKIRFT